MSKPNKQPPPIPKQLDQPSVKSLKETSVVNPEIGGSTLTPISQKRPLKSTLSAPSQAGISRTELPKSEISKSQELSVQKSINEAVQEKSLPENASVLADKDWEKTKLKSSEQNQRLVLGFKNDKMNEGKTVMSSSIDPIRLNESQSQNRSSVEHKTSYKCFEGQKPTPPPRKVSKVADKRPVIPPRKHHNVLSEVSVEGTSSNGINKGDADLSKLVPHGHKHDAKSMHPLPFHTELTDTKVKECQKGLEEKNLDSNRIGPSQEWIGGAKPDGLGDVLQINENILSQSKRSFKSRTLKELIEMKCEREAVNLLEYPYTVVVCLSSCFSCIHTHPLFLHFCKILFFAHYFFLVFTLKTHYLPVLGDFQLLGFVKTHFIIYYRMEVGIFHFFSQRGMLRSLVVTGTS